MSFQGAMTWAEGKLGRVVVARLAPGSDLRKSLAELAEKSGIANGLILGGAASLKKVVLRCPKGFCENPPMTDEYRVFVNKHETMEMLSLSGNISRLDGRLVIHAHIAVALGLEEGLAYGGHLEEGCLVYTTAEIAIAEIEGVQMVRLENEETKNHELCPLPETT